MEETNDRRTQGRRSKVKIILGCVLLALAGVLLWACALFRFDKWHRLEPELIAECDKSLLIYDRSGELICAPGPTKRISVDISELSPTTVNAFIAAEDQRFYSHEGIDLYRIFGAAWADIKAGGYVQGASTISQQLIKLSHLSKDKTFDRKLEEAVLALELENRFDKEEILEMYLNYVYFGGGYYGIEAASLGYFDRHASELTLAQAAQLAGILKSPSAYAPHIDPEASEARRDTVLGAMYELGFIGKAELEAALAEKNEAKGAFPNERSQLTDYAAAEAEAILGISENELMTGGYSVYTTIDRQLDEACARLMSNDASFPSDNAQGALVILSTSGGILAMQGSRGGYSPGSLNRAAAIERQPGSLIKPILVYAPALEFGGFTSASVLKDEPMSFGDYSPRNSDEKYYGSVTLRQAVARSLNVPAVYVLSQVGLTNAVCFAERMGIDFEGEALSLALALGGFTHGVSPLEICASYAALANGGVYVRPTSIERIIDNTGKTVYERSVSGERVMSRENAYILTSMLQSAASEGTGRRLAETGLPLAAKTGTSVDANGIRDAWCACYSPEYAAVAWMGADSAAEGSLPQEAVGGSYTAVMLGSIFEALYRGRERPEFAMPQGIVKTEIDTYCAALGEVYLANELTPKEYSREECFIKGSEPAMQSGHWQAPEPPQELGWSIDAQGRPVISFVSQSRVLIYIVNRKDEFGNISKEAEFTGRKGLIQYVDEQAQPGRRYAYFITACHPDIKENGQPLSGSPSREIIVELNRAGP